MLRSPAILLTLILEVMVGLIVAKFAGTLEKHILLASFMPVLSSLSGNIGLQASTSTLRALATGHASHSTGRGIKKTIIRELGSALFISVALGCILFLVGWIWSGSIGFGTVTALSVLCAASFAGIIGCLSPIIFKKLQFDPAVTAGPFETAIQDLIGITLYLTFATVFLS